MKGLDTNILLRLYVGDDSVQGNRARRYVAQHCREDDPCRINRATLCEFAWVLRRGYRYAPAEIAALFERMLLAVEFIVEDATAATHALRHMREGHDFADALVGLTNQEHGCTCTATFDRNAAKLNFFEPV